MRAAPRAAPPWRSFGPGAWASNTEAFPVVGTAPGAGSTFPVVGDGTGGTVDQVGTFERGVWHQDTNGNGRWEGCAVDTCVDATHGGLFGEYDDYPAVGSWALGSSTRSDLGVWRASTGSFYLDKNNDRMWDTGDTTVTENVGVGGVVPIACAAAILDSPPRFVDDPGFFDPATGHRWRGTPSRPRRRRRPRSARRAPFPSCAERPRASDALRAVIEPGRTSVATAGRRRD